MQTAGARARAAGVLLRTQPDARLVRFAREGHEAAAEEIVRRYRAALVAFAAGIVPRDRAEDVVQEALARALVALRRTDAEIALRPWLYAIVRNRALNDLRGERPAEALNEDVDGVAQPPDVLALRAELSRTVAAIGALPDAQRTALVQRVFEGRGHEEIAAGLGVSPGAVRQLIFRARAALRGLAGLAVPPPLLRHLLTGADAGPLAAGAGGGALVKAGALLAAGALTVGSGLEFHHRLAAQRERAGAPAVARSSPPARALGASFPARVASPAPSAETERGTGGREAAEGDDGGGGSGPSGSAGPGGPPGSGGDDIAQGTGGDASGSGGDDATSGSGDGAGGAGGGDSGGGDSGGSPGSGSGDGGSLDSGSGDDVAPADQGDAGSGDGGGELTTVASGEGD